MPLEKGKSEAVIGSNIAELYHANASKKKGEKRSPEQIKAIAEAEARRSGKK